MPTYDFRCMRCGSAFEVRLGFDDERPAVCEACGGGLKQVYSAPSFQRSGHAVDPLHTPGAEFLSNPDSFRTSMQAFEAQTGLGLTSGEMDTALDRLKHAN